MDYYQRCEWAFAQQGISSAEKFILVAMAKRAGNDLAEYFQSIASLCEETALNRKTAIKSLKALCESGLISDTGKRVGDTKQVVVYQINGIFDMINNSKSDDLNSTKNGTVPELEQFQLFPETVPNLPANSTVFSAKESQIYAETVPNLGHGTNTLTKTLTKNICDENIENLFVKFYNAYPGHRKNRTNAKKAWDKLKPSDELAATIMSALELAKKSRDWLKDDGQYIPAPAVWLNKRRWEDEINSAPPTPDARETAQSSFLGIAGLI
ncbi:helix-turn-helix domain-containing protein [Methylomonas rosea]|uniref:Helix-turn-helix domain-containing protein n=1 Tax=Methylomonas rosea TaxID=2952227 RepID=A0ABT1TYJ5_9GAMM|nr:helix-turn-helix domain-containing protein [Methylomonas sp. WSC-7]MCQ8119829.1 helix-turn-helix domain-containing protein [Methylomonas sp. WSC-7]